MILGLRKYVVCFLLLVLVGCSGDTTPRKQNQPAQPEITASIKPRPAATAKNFMVSSAYPEATQAGLEILKAGGTAIDAAIAVQMVLNVVEPQSSGIGGGLFLLYYDKKTKKVTAIDGREAAPAKIDPNVFIGADGKPIDYMTALVGGRSVGVPGALKAYKLAHEKFGKLSWDKLFEPGIRVAKNGFQITKRLHRLLNRNKHVAKSPTARDYFYRRGTVKARLVGDTIKNPELAKTFEMLAKEGPDAFYNGQIAADIATAVTTSYANPGVLELTDLQNYQAIEREVICTKYREFKICGMPPPSSGGIGVAELMGILEKFDLKNIKPNSLEAVHLFAQASRLVYADRAKYVADPDFVKVPVKKLLDPRYIKDRAKLVGDKDSGFKAAGVIPDDQANLWATEACCEIPGTSHFSIVDSFGNAVSVTTSIEYAFGSTIVVDGFLLNNQLTDFSFVSEVDGKPVANRIEPGKRPRSSMAPTLVFDNKGNLVLTLGSAGGARIISFVAQSLVAVLDWQMDPQQAFELGHYTHMNTELELEEKTALIKLIPELKLKSYVPLTVDINSGLHGIQIMSEGLIGGVDPRRDGLAAGD